MTLTWALESSLRDMTFAESGERWYPQVNHKPHYETNNVFPKFLEVIIPFDGECFIPVLGFEKTINLIQSWFGSVGPTSPMKLSYPLYVGGCDTKRTADSIIQAINKCPASLRLTNIKTSKGLDYYGGSGLILDERWSPMMLCGYIVNIDRLNRNIKVVRPVCYVSPTILESNDIISKALVKKVIPFLSTSNISVPSGLRNMSYLTFNSETFGRIPVTINYLDRYFVTPRLPRNLENLDEDIWTFLNGNMTDLV